MGTTTLLMGFDASNIQPFGGGAAALPVGQRMLVQIIDADVRGSRNSSGSNNTSGGVSLTFQVLDGEHQGKVGAEWYHLYPAQDADQKAGEIAKQKLAAIAYATGRINIGNDLRQWFGVPFRIDTTAQADQPNRTNIIAYYDANGTSVQQLASGGGRIQGAAPQQAQVQQNYQQSVPNNQPAPGFQNNGAPQYNPNAAAPIGGPAAGFQNTAAPAGFAPNNQPAPGFNPNQGAAPGFQQPAAGFNQPPATAPAHNPAPGFQQPGFQNNGAPAAFGQGPAQTQPAAGQWGAR